MRANSARRSQWRTYSTSIIFVDCYPLDTPSGSVVEDNRTFSESDLIGSRLSYRLDASHLGTLTVGAQSEVDLRAYQGSKDVAPVPMVFVNINRRDKTLAFFVQDEKKLSPHWSLNLGARYDLSTYRKNFVSPRAALIYQPSGQWSFKFLFGRSFATPAHSSCFMAMVSMRRKSGCVPRVRIPSKSTSSENWKAHEPGSGGIQLLAEEFPEGALHRCGLFQIKTGQGTCHWLRDRIQRPAVPMARNGCQLCLPEVADYDANGV